MQNDAGEIVDKFIPRKCSVSNTIIGAKDHASVQIALSELDPTTGRITGNNTTYNVAGRIRRMGESDDSVLRLAVKSGICNERVLRNIE